MGATIGVVIGVIATIIVSRYYFRRSVNTSLGVYGLLNSYVFAGITDDVRTRLHFRFEGREVQELQQLVFLVANDGERPIRAPIRPLCLSVPPSVELLDASIIHRRPEGLEIAITQSAAGGKGSSIAFEFPLLNKGEFFVAKLLISGRFPVGDVRFTILAEDLPRSLVVRATPPAALQDAAFRVDWALASVGSFLILFDAWIARALYTLRAARPELFPWPWHSFQLSLEAASLVVPAFVVLPVVGGIGLAMLVGSFFGGEFPPRRGPRFPLPRELREAVFPYALVADPGLKPTAWAEPIKDVKPAFGSGEFKTAAEPGDGTTKNDAPEG